MMMMISAFNSSGSSGCPSTTSCLWQSDLSSDSEQFGSCGGEGFVNAGSLFYAYDYPVDSSANTGYEIANTMIIYFVQG